MNTYVGTFELKVASTLNWDVPYGVYDICEPYGIYASHDIGNRLLHLDLA